MSWASLMAQTVKNLPAMQDTQIWSLGQEDHLQKGMAIHSSILAWKIPWTQEAGSYSPWGHKELDTTEWLTFLGSIAMNKASGGDGMPVEVFQILKDDAVKVLRSICQQIWKTQQWPQDWKNQFSFQYQRKAMPKNAQTTTPLHSSHMLVK